MDFYKENSLARVNFTGGIIGLLAGSQLARLEKVIAAKNKDGWNLAEVVPETRNLIVFVIRVILLILTLGFWTLSTGYILIFERPKTAPSSGNVDKSGRREPVLRAGPPAR